MGRIHRLSDAVIALVAAGEVVTTPASVVKELVENSLDAGARRIDVEIERGGLTLIRVRDDGCGMDGADAAAALVRHATSKLLTAEDLERIGSFGFRGEALASLAAVADVVLTTQQPDEATGWTVQARAGDAPEAPRASVRTPGTTIEARQLFRAVPARLAFLESVTTETNRVLKVVRDAALAHPSVHLTFDADGRRLVDAPAAADLRDRVRQLHGAAFADALLAIRAERDGVQLEGLVSLPEAAPRQTRKSAFFVNQRPFTSAELRRIVWQAMKERLGPGTYPEAILAITLEPARVDVNVSPDKSTVRFEGTVPLFALVHRAVQAALADPFAAAYAREAHLTSPAPVAEPTPIGGTPPAAPAASVEPAPAPAAAPLRLALSDVAPEAMTSTDAPRRLPRRPAVLAQVARSFLLATLDDGVLYVDQHSLHERLIYETLVARGHAAERQGLLLATPIPTPTVDARLLLEALQPSLDAVGFSIEPSGPDSYWLTAAPTWVGQRDPAQALSSAVQALASSQGRARGDLEAVRERALRTIACHAAVRAGEVLAPAEIDALWVAAQTIDLAMADVHGRPGAVFVPHEEIARRLARGGLPVR